MVNNEGIISETKIMRSIKDGGSLEPALSLDAIEMDEAICGCDTVTRDRYKSYLSSCQCTHGECMCYRD